MDDLYSLQSSDIEYAQAVLTEAFVQDPLFSYMLGPNFGDKSFIKSMHTFILNLGIKYGKAYSPSPNMEGIAVWLPPGSTDITLWKILLSGAIPLRWIFAHSFKELIGMAKKMMSYMKYSDAQHEKHAPHLHWYLFEIGISDKFRNKGYASRLLKPILEKCDQDGMACYLETHNEKNVGLYSHFGFTVKEAGKLPGSNITHWAMLRNPIASSS